MTEQPIIKEQEIELSKPDLKSVLWKHLDRLNYISSTYGDSKEFVNTVETLVCFLRCWKTSQDIFVGKIKEIDNRYGKTLANSNKDKFLQIQIQAADEKRNACMDFIGDHLGGETGRTEY